jgi:hypothetical protein
MKDRVRWLRFFCFVLSLLCPGLPAIAQNASIAYQSLPDDQVDALALKIPADDHGRYQELRDEFAALHCPSDAPREQRTGKRDATNLICTLAGQNPGLIVVVSRYDRQKGAVVSSRWSEAILLPLLYNALRQQPKTHTFVFAALNGEAGEQAFFQELRKNGSSSVETLVVLEDLGRSTPYIYTPKPYGLSKKNPGIAAAMDVLESEAVVTASLQGIAKPTMPHVWTGMFNNSILDREYETPSIMIFSSVQTKLVSPTSRNDYLTPSPGPEPVTGPFVRRTFDFVAYFLCRIDLKVPV